MSEDAKILVVDAVSHAMATIFGVPEKAFQWAPEAASLIQKWVDLHGDFGASGIVQSLLWWQDQATDENPYPLTKEMSHGRR